ncbi:AXL1 [Candida theae]|uniref:AXL1 n=1 Tax=Candida theae TaxID=1198502 RepID=A0AAD5FWU0_9ASCO|nr:AXL1 [Candida theae]KAI5949820.1 AXL1 [Candida theae]
MGFFSVKELASVFKKPCSALHNSYKYIQLENGLRTLLISDPKCNATAAAVCVGSGSYCDPDELPGLAHFCEHMLFMGTDEFPNPNDFWTKLTSMGGSTNAYTMGDYTCVYFETSMADTLVGEEFGLNYLMRNFSSFFKKPLFLEKYLAMEINNVDDEHQGNVINNEKILYHGLRLLSSKGHPFHRFGTGNKSTLSSKYTREAMMKYFDDNFVSENMVLVLKGSQSLNQLQKLVLTTFVDIPTSQDLSSKTSASKRRNKIRSMGSKRSSITTTPSLDVTSKVFPSDATGKLLYIKSETSSQVRLFLPIHDFENSFYESVWCSLLGDESLGSLCHYLKTTKKCISSLYVHTQRLSQGNKILVMDFDILKCFSLNFIIQAIWSFVDQVLDLDLAHLNNVLNEYSRVFKYQAYFSTSELSVMDEAANYASCLMEGRIQDMEYLVTGDSFLFECDAIDFAKKTREIFNVSNLNAIVLAEGNNWDRPLPSNFTKDPYYRFDYAITDLNYSSSVKSIPQFFVPTQNTFIALAQNELDNQMKRSKHTSPYLSEADSATPRLIDFSTYHEIWHSESSSFDAVTSFQICFSSIPSTTLNSVAIEILADCIGDTLKPLFYQAELALFSWGIFANLVTTPSLSFEIRGPIAGFTYFLKRFVVTVKNLISSFSLDYKEFVAKKSHLRTSYNDLQIGDANTKVVAASVMILEQGIAGIEERLEAVEFLETSDLVCLCHSILRDHKHTDILVTGGDHDFAIKVCKTINALTFHEKIYLEKHPFTFASSVLLRRGRNYDLVIENSNSKDPNDIAYYYIQLCSRRGNESIIAHFLAYQMNQFVRYQLRTRRQVGYLILSGIRINKSTIGLYLLINSSSYDYASILSEIENVLFEWEMEVLTMTDDQFAEAVESFLKSRGQQDIDSVPSNISAATKPTKQSDNYSAKQLHSINFDSIVTKNYDFGSCVNGAFTVANTFEYGLADIIKFFRERVSIKSTQRATLSILVSSKRGKTKKDFDAKKEMLASLLDNHDYQLTSLQLQCLLHESNNDASAVIQKLKSLGYRISTKQTPKLFKVLLVLKSLKGSSSKESVRCQKFCIANYGSDYRTNLRALPHLTVSDVDEIHAEASFISQSGHMSQLQEIYDNENEQENENENDCDLNFLL